MSDVTKEINIIIVSLCVLRRGVFERLKCYADYISVFAYREELTDLS